MNYKFPIIKNINDVLPSIENSPEFIVAEKDGYTVINYVVAGRDTFPNVNSGDALADLDAEVRRECRGLIFDTAGKLISRRYHKFFNVNERDETSIDKIDWSMKHHILEKLDGSMVSPCIVNDKLVWMTKMGVTDVSMQAAKFVENGNEHYIDFAYSCIEAGLTPIFEWVSNKNRIVLDYPEDNLILTAVRIIENGQYLSHEWLNFLTKNDIPGDKQIPVVRAYDPVEYDGDIVELVRSLEDSEGVVVRFRDGHMIKIKSDWYVRIHKVKSLLESEKDVVLLILNNELDDLLPILPKEDIAKIEVFQNDLMKEIRQLSWDIFQITKSNRETIDRKTFALKFADSLNPIIRSFVFKFWDKEIGDGQLVYNEVVNSLIMHCSSNSRYEKFKSAFSRDISYSQNKNYAE